MPYDVVIVGGGPAGLSAALNLGRARKRVLVCDGGEPRNVAAKEIHGFVTRDGTPPPEFRRIGREQLEPYQNVEVRTARVVEIHGQRGAFDVHLDSGRVEAKRILLSTGMIDELPEIEGFRALWGHAIFQCPYCHGWELQNQRFGYLATSPEALGFPLLLRGWSSHVTVFTEGRFEIPADARASFAAAGIRVEERKIARLAATGQRLEGVELAAGISIPFDVLFAHPRQRQVDLVRTLGLALTPAGQVVVDARLRETSVPGVYAGGDLVTPGIQTAALATASGALAAYMLNHELTATLATSGALR